MNSLERRLVVSLAALLLLLFAFLFWGSVSSVRSLSEAQLLTRLEHDAEALVAAYGENHRGQIRLREGRITPIYKQPLSGHYYVLEFDDGSRIRSRSLWDEDLAVELLPPGAVAVQHLLGPGGQQLLARSAGYEKSGQRFTLLVTEDLTPLERQITHFQWWALGLLGVAMLIVVLLQRFLLRRGFSSLDRVRTEISLVSEGVRGQIAELGPSEVRPLTTEINRLLHQLQQRLTRSRQALGNLAHALKAPLTLLNRDVETLPLSDVDRRRLDTRLQHISQLIERQLKRARIAAGGSGQHFVPARHVAELIEAVGLLYSDRAVEITTGTLPDSAVPFDREDMLELLGNLLDNACKWATGRVELGISVDLQDLIFTVADDGVGVDKEARNVLLERGSRLDEQMDGHGLGLAIVKDLVDDYNGDLELSRSATLGGLEVGVRLPLSRHGTE